MSTDIQNVYVYVAATVPLNDDMLDQVRAFSLQRMEAEEPSFGKIMEKIKREKIPIVTGYGVGSSEDNLASFKTWLKAQGGISLNEARKVMGKKIFIHGGEAHIPADGSKFSWSLLVCFY